MRLSEDTIIPTLSNILMTIKKLKLLLFFIIKRILKGATPQKPPISQESFYENFIKKV